MGVFVDTYDHYKEAHELIQSLIDAGLNEHADALTRSMDEGSTGTEIFMALRWHLERLLGSGACPEIAIAKAKRLFDEIDKALK